MNIYEKSLELIAEETMSVYQRARAHIDTAVNKRPTLLINHEKSQHTSDTYFRMTDLWHKIGQGVGRHKFDFNEQGAFSMTIEHDLAGGFLGDGTLLIVIEENRRRAPIIKEMGTGVSCNSEYDGVIPGELAIAKSIPEGYAFCQNEDEYGIFYEMMMPQLEMQLGTDTYPDSLAHSVYSINLRKELTIENTKELCRMLNVFVQAYSGAIN